VPLLLFLFLLAVYLATGGGKGYSVDGAFGYEMSKTFLLDPQHSYFRRFKTAFARWGALMPLLGQPFVLAGDALAGIAPERDALDAGGHRFLVEEWPAMGAVAPGRGSYVPPAPATGGRPVRAVAIVSFLANGLTVPQGAVVGEVRLYGAGGETVLPVRAGLETAEWALDRPDVAGQAGHRRPPVAGHWIGQPRGNLYYARLDLPQPLRVESWELRPGVGLGAAQWQVRSAAFDVGPGSASGPASGGGLSSDDRPGAAWVDVQTGERFWSPRETRDFFTRLVYAALNAFTTAGAAVVVYALTRRFGYTVPTAAVTAVGYGLGTMAWPYARLDFSEPAATLCVLVAVWAFFIAFPPPVRPSLVEPSSEGAPPARSRPIWLGLLAAGALLLGIAGKYTAALFAVALVAQWAVSAGWWRPPGRRPALRFLAALVIPAAVLGTVAVAVSFRLTGETPIVLTSGTDRLWEDWLALPLWTGLRGLLFSPGKSLFLYSPWLLLAVPGSAMFLRRHGRDGLLFSVLPALIVLLYSMKLGWHGGSWGPRYLLPIVPFLAVAAAPAIEWCLARRAAGGRPGAGVPEGAGSRPGAGTRRGRWPSLFLAGLAIVSVGVQLLGLAKDPERYPAMVREFVVPALPDGGSRLGGRDYWLARGGPGLGRALQDADPASGRRGLGYLWGYPDAALLVEPAAARRFTLSLYFVDWDRQSRRQTVTVEDADGRRSWTLDRDFGDGLWASWEVSTTPERPLRVTLRQDGRDTAVVSAATFDAPGRGGQAAPQVDARTRGDWRGVYGADGYVLFAWRSFNVDVAAPPDYVRRYELSNVGDKPDPRIHVEIAEADVLDTPLLYAAPFSPLLGNAWLLLADVVHLLLPARPDLVLAVLARPPWSWLGVAAPLPPRPEYGLGLDFWPTLLYVNYASHGRFMLGVWSVLLALEVVATATGAALVWRLVPATDRRRWTVLAGAGLGLAGLLYVWLQVQA
jgi:hypothetical protein